MRVGRTVVVGVERAGQPAARCPRWLSLSLTAAIIIAIPVAVAAVEWHLQSRFAAVRELVHHAASTAVPSFHLDARPVHFSSSPVTVPAISDGDFGIEARGLKVQRQVQICQWMQSFIDSTHKVRNADGSEDKVTTRTYYYTKGWVDSPINSLFFDQPGAHFNPQNMPYRSSSQLPAFPVPLVNGYNLQTSVLSELKGTFQPLKWDQRNIERLSRSPAYLQNGFKYTGGADGWLYSSHEPSVMEKVGRFGMMAMEGSLLDFQLGDLFSQCNSGDMRANFRVMSPSEVTVVAVQLNSQGDIGPFTASNGKTLSLVREGIHSLQRMGEMEISDHKWGLYINRIIGIIYAITVSILAYKRFFKVQEPKKD